MQFLPSWNTTLEQIIFKTLVHPLDKNLVIGNHENIALGVYSAIVLMVQNFEKYLNFIIVSHDSHTNQLTELANECSRQSWPARWRWTVESHRCTSPRSTANRTSAAFLDYMLLIISSYVIATNSPVSDIAHGTPIGRVENVIHDGCDVIVDHVRHRELPVSSRVRVERHVPSRILVTSGVWHPDVVTGWNAIMSMVIEMIGLLTLSSQVRSRDCCPQFLCHRLQAVLTCYRCCR